MRSRISQPKISAQFTPLWRDKGGNFKGRGAGEQAKEIILNRF